MYSYIPKGVCSRRITYDIRDGKVYDIHFDGGCSGNTQGVAALAEGRSPEEIIKLLEHINCASRNNGTSCPDQLAQALKEALKQEKTSVS